MPLRAFEGGPEAYWANTEALRVLLAMEARGDRIMTLAGDIAITPCAPLTKEQAAIIRTHRRHLFRLARYCDQVPAVPR